VGNYSIASLEHMMVDPIDHSSIHIATPGRRQQHLFGTRLQMSTGTLFAIKTTGTLKHDIDIELVPGQLARITYGQQADWVTINHQMLLVIGQRYLSIKTTMHRIKLGQVAGNFILTGCINCNDLDIVRFVLFIKSTQRHAPNAAIAINRNTNGHREYS